MNGLSTGEQKQALHHRTGGAAALPHWFHWSTGPGAVYPSHVSTLTATEPGLTADRHLYGILAPTPAGQ